MDGCEYCNAQKPWHQILSLWLQVNHAVHQRFKCLLGGGAPTNYPSVDSGNSDFSKVFMAFGSEVMVMNNGPNSERRSVNVVFAYMDELMCAF